MFSIKGYMITPRVPVFVLPDEGRWRESAHYGGLAGIQIKPMKFSRRVQPEPERTFDCEIADVRLVMRPPNEQPTLARNPIDRANGSTGSDVQRIVCDGWSIVIGLSKFDLP